MYQLENSIEEKETFPSNSLPREEVNKVDEYLIPLIEQIILEKETIHFQREKQLIDKIQALENKISMLKDHVEQSKIADHRQTPTEDDSTIEHKTKKEMSKKPFIRKLT